MTTTTGTYKWSSSILHNGQQSGDGDSKIALV